MFPEGLSHFRPAIAPLKTGGESFIFFFFEDQSDMTQWLDSCRMYCQEIGTIPNSKSRS